MTPGPALLQGLARILGGDPEGSAAALEDEVRLGEYIGAHEVSAAALSEQSLRAMAGGEWNQAEVLAGQAGTVLRKGGMEDSYVTPLVCAAQARAALHRGNAAAARQELIRAQRTRPLLTYAVPHIAVQARVELVRGTGAFAASALTGAELRLLPLLATHMTFPQIARELGLSPHTIKTQAHSVYRRLDVSTRSEAVARARELGLLDRLQAGGHKGMEQTRWRRAIPPW